MTVMSQSLKFPVSFASPWNTSLVLRLALGTGKHNQAFSARSRPSGPLFLLLVFTFPSAIRHKLFMAKLLLTVFMQRLVQWHPFSAGASGHSCNTNNHDDSNNNNSQLCFSHWAHTSSVLSHRAQITVFHYRLLVSARAHSSINLPHPLEQEKNLPILPFRFFFNYHRFFLIWENPSFL